MDAEFRLKVPVYDSADSPGARPYYLFRANVPPRWARCWAGDYEWRRLAERVAPRLEAAPTLHDRRMSLTLAAYFALRDLLPADVLLQVLAGAFWTDE